jgi:hypothetical protein
MNGMNAIHLRQFFPSEYSVICAYLVNLFVREFRCTIVLPLQLATCIDLVLDIVRLCTNF